MIGIQECNHRKYDVHQYDNERQGVLSHLEKGQQRPYYHGQDDTQGKEHHRWGRKRIGEPFHLSLRSLQNDLVRGIERSVYSLQCLFDGGVPYTVQSSFELLGELTAEIGEIQERFLDAVELPDVDVPEYLFQVGGERFLHVIGGKLYGGVQRGIEIHGHGHVVYGLWKPPKRLYLFLPGLVHGVPEYHVGDNWRP